MPLEPGGSSWARVSRSVSWRTIAPDIELLVFGRLTVETLGRFKWTHEVLLPFLAPHCGDFHEGQHLHDSIRPATTVHEQKQLLAVLGVMSISMIAPESSIALFIGKDRKLLSI